MNIQNNIKRVLVYGDSFTYGKQAGVNARLAADVRYTGVLQSILGDGVEIVEEGLRGRNLVGENPFFPDRDGLATFGSIASSHLPVDVLIIFLGTNDCNDNPEFNAQKNAESLREYIAKLQNHATFLGAPLPKVLIVLPPDIDESRFDEFMVKVFGTGASERVKQLRQELLHVSGDMNLPTLDASKIVVPALEDGIHLDTKNNRKLAEAISEELRELLR